MPRVRIFVISNNMQLKEDLARLERIGFTPDYSAIADLKEDKLDILGVSDLRVFPRRFFCNDKRLLKGLVDHQYVERIEVLEEP